MAMTLHTKLAPMAAVANHPASGVPIRRPTNTSTTNDASGSSVAIVSSKAGVSILCAHPFRLLRFPSACCYPFRLLARSTSMVAKLL
jgi:hypothetical protein